MTDYICRFMQEADLSEVVDLVQGASDFAWSLQSIRQSLLSNNDNSFVLCSMGGLDILAYAVIHKVLDESHLLNIVIKKEEQGRGLGAYFLKQLIKTEKDQNQHSLLLEVRASNVIAIKLYESIGFQLDGTRKDYYPRASGREDARLYSLSLG
jgi:[ribosomal protein S18]-alanine N-acetyltransferase